MRTILITALSFLTFALSAQDVSSTSKSVLNDENGLLYNHYLLTAVGEMTIGNTRRAYDQLILLNCEQPSAQVSYYMARILQDMGRLSEALPKAAKAVELDSTNNDYLQLEGQLLIETKDYAKAQMIFEKLIQKDPNTAQNYIMACALAMETGSAKEALAIANAHEERFGLDDRMVEIKRASLMAQEQYYDAMEYMGRVVDAMPTEIQHIISLGDINAGLGLSKTALELYNRAVDLDSSDMQGYLALANYYDVKGDVPKYISVLAKLFSLDNAPVELKIKIFEGSFFTPAPYRNNMTGIRMLAQTLQVLHSDNVEVQMLYGRFLAYVGLLEQARDHYLAMLDNGMENRALWDYILDICFYRKDNAQALEIVNRALAKYPKDPMLIYRRITAQWLAQSGEEAIKSIKKALKEFTVDSIQGGLFALRGDIYHELQRDKQAFRDYDRALAINPDNALVLNNYAYFLALRDERLEDALAMAVRACELQKDFSTYMDTHAWVLFRLGRLDAAAAVQQSAIALDNTRSADILLHYGDILYAMGDDFMARTYWKRALDAGSDKKIIDERLARPKAVKIEK